jgi:hypothetical protein
MAFSMFLEIFISRRFYTEKSTDFTQKYQFSICEY